eukprot:6071793-Pyramimonas_sp.AAC.1
MDGEADPFEDLDGLLDDQDQDMYEVPESSPMSLDVAKNLCALVPGSSMDGEIAPSDELTEFLDDSGVPGPQPGPAARGEDPDQVAAQRRQEVIQRELQRYTQNWIGDPRSEQQTEQEVTEDWME